jgi:hypothetical protein
VSRTTLLVLLCGLIEACLFTIVYLIEGITRSSYNAWQQPVSALSLGPGEWVQQINFIAFGVISLCTVLAVRQILKGATWYSILRVLGAFSFKEELTEQQSSICKLGLDKLTIYRYY